MGTNRHAERTAPSVASIVSGLIALGGVALGIAYILLGLDTDGWVGVILGASLWVVLLGQVYGRIIERGDMLRAAERRREPDEDEIEEELVATGDQFDSFVPAWAQETQVVPRYPAETYPDRHAAPGLSEVQRAIRNYGGSIYNPSDIGNRISSPRYLD